MDIEHKLDLIQQIHREQEENERHIYDSLICRNYNRTFNIEDDYGYDYRNYKKDSGIQKVQDSMFSLFRLRVLVSIVLFLCFIIMDKEEIVYKEIGSNEIVEYISKTMDISELSAMLIGK